MFTKQVTKRQARNLAGMYPIPMMGDEIVVALKHINGMWYEKLRLQNVSGTFQLHSNNVPVEDWPNVFQVKA